MSKDPRDYPPPKHARVQPKVIGMALRVDLPPEVPEPPELANKMLRLNIEPTQPPETK